MTPRYLASSIQFPNGDWWLAGGLVETLGVLDSSVLFVDGTFRPSVTLPVPVFGSCVVNLNGTHLALVGGATSQTTATDEVWFLEWETRRSALKVVLLIATAYRLFAYSSENRLRDGKWNMYLRFLNS